MLNVHKNIVCLGARRVVQNLRVNLDPHGGPEDPMPDVRRPYLS